jgi:hypothetical protein
LESEAFDLEKKLIALIGRLPFEEGPLCNFTKGGEGISGLIHSEESKIKMSLARKGTKLSEEHKRKISEAQKGRKPHLLTEETKRKISEARKGRKNPHLGTPRTEESKRKNSESHKGKVPTEESKRKMSEAALLRPPMSEAIRKKISDSVKRTLSLKPISGGERRAAIG